MHFWQVIFFCISVALNFNPFGRNSVTTFPWLGCFKSMLGYMFTCKIPKIFRVFVQDVPFVRNNDLSETCQCLQLKLNLLSMKITMYCLTTNQMPALLVQCIPWMWAAALLLQLLYFSCPSCPSVHLKIKMATINGKTCYISTILQKK